MADSRAALSRSRLYLVTDPAPGERVLRAALEGGVDVLQLRDKDASDEQLLAAAPLFRRLCNEHRALFIVNDRPAVAALAGADGIHVGQEDEPVDVVRAQVGPDFLIGCSTHTPDQLRAALQTDADYVCAGPVWETPTKPGYAPAGLELVRLAAEICDRPWFAIGGIDAGNLQQVIAAGAQRIVVVRAIRDAEDPRAAAEALRA